MNSKFFNFTLPLLIFALFSCKLGDEYSRPDNSAQKISEFSNQSNSSEKRLDNLDFWWRDINDKKFSEYVAQMLQNNLTIKQNYQKTLQALENVKIEKGGLFPDLGTNINASRNITPANGIAGFNFGGNNTIYNTNYRAELSSTWQIDLFGKIRRSIESSQSEFLASKNDLEALKQSLIAKLLQRRVSIASNSKLLDLAINNAKNKKNIYKLTKRRYNLGVNNVNLSDVLKANESYLSAKSQIEKYDRILESDIYEFEILLGEEPNSTNLRTENFNLMKKPRKAPKCFPLNLLDRRPDLLASELRVKAANARIGVAIADLYPDLSISANYGYRADSAGSLLNSDQLGGSLAGNIMTKLFPGGILRANIKLKKARAEELTAGYAQNILTAIKEVETALYNENNLEKEIQNNQQSLRSINYEKIIFEKRYEKGLVNLDQYLEVVNRKNQIESTLINSIQASWNNRISLYLALGGNWINGDSQCQKISVK